MCCDGMVFGASSRSILTLKDLRIFQDCPSILKLEKVNLKMTISYLSNLNSTFSIYLKVSVN